jgi:hypothetical protein
MKVRCTGAQLSTEQKAILGPRFKENQTFDLTVGTEYDVLGMSFTFNAPARGTGAYVIVAPATDRVTIAPLALFEVTQTTVPSNWQLRVGPDETELLSEELLGRHFFHDLSEREPAALDALRRALEQGRR